MRTLKIIFVVVGCLLGLIILMACAFVAIRLLLSMMFGAAIAEYLDIAVVVFLMFLPWSRLHSRKPYEIAADAEINAPVQAVWDTIVPRDCADYYQAKSGPMEDLGGGRFRLHQNHDLPRDQDGMIPALELEVTDLDEARYLRYVPLNAKEMPLWASDYVSSEFYLGALPNGRTHVRMVETLSCLRITSFVNSLFVNTSREGLKSLKARCEGSEDTSLIATMSSKHVRNVVIGTAVSTCLVLVWGIFEILAYTT